MFLRQLQMIIARYHLARPHSDKEMILFIKKWLHILNNQRYDIIIQWILKILYFSGHLCKDVENKLF